MAKKSRMTAIIDYNNMGLHLTSEMEIGRESYKSLRKALQRACVEGLGDYQAKFKLLSGDYLKGNARFILTFPTRVS